VSGVPDTAFSEPSNSQIVLFCMTCAALGSLRVSCRSFIKPIHAALSPQRSGSSPVTDTPRPAAVAVEELIERRIPGEVAPSAGVSVGHMGTRKRYLGMAPKLLTDARETSY